MVFKYHLIRNKEKPNFIYVFNESKTKLLATIDEEKKTEDGLGELVLVSENIVLDIGYIVKRAKSKFTIKITKEQRQSHCDQLIKMKVDLGDALQIEDIIWSYEDEYRKQ